MRTVKELNDTNTIFYISHHPLISEHTIETKDLNDLYIHLDKIYGHAEIRFKANGRDTCLAVFENYDYQLWRGNKSKHKKDFIKQIEFILEQFKIRNKLAGE